MATTTDIEARRAKLVDVISRQGVMSLGELCSLTGVSESTVRRDLEALEAQGALRRTYGGAVCTRYDPAPLLGFADRVTSMHQAKQAIGRVIAERIVDGQTIIIDGGTTCWAVAQALAGRHLSVVTNSVPIAALLYPDVSAEVALIGGYLYPRTGVALGATAEAQLAGLQASALVMSCAGLTPEGVYNVNEMMVEVERQMMAVADRVILAADHSKFNRRALARQCALREIDVLVTDSGVAPADLAWLSELELELVVAPLAGEGPS
jgi:DeoR family transcriptional regulator, fructose operon transcriptional repressor